MGKLIWAGLGIPLVMLLVLTVIRLIQYDASFSPVALTAAGLYVVAAAPVCAWLNAKGFSAPRAPGYVFGYLTLFGLSMTVRGLGLVRGSAALLVMGLGTGSLVAAAVVSWRTNGGGSGRDLVAAPGAETTPGKEGSTTLDAESGGRE